MPLLSPLHVLLIIAAYALLTAAGGMGVVFLIQEHWMKARRVSPLAALLPSLEEMDAWVHRMILLAFPLLSVGMVLGAFRAHDLWGRYWDWSPKETLALITWLVYMAFLVARWAYSWRGRKSTYLSLAGFFLAVTTYALVYLIRFNA